MQDWETMNNEQQNDWSTIKLYRIVETRSCITFEKVTNYISPFHRRRSNILNRFPTANFPLDFNPKQPQAELNRQTRINHCLSFP